MNDNVDSVASDRIEKSPFLNMKQWIALLVFTFAAVYLSGVVPTVEIAWVLSLLILTIYLFAFEVVAVDVAAISVMVLLGLSDLLAPYIGLQSGLVDNDYLFSGFSSNAVMSIIAVMIIGAGLDKTGLMSKVASVILRIGGNTESRIIPIISSSVGGISSFMQNVGATALFLPVVSRISARSGLPMSRLLMPMGFTAILGGTVTMVGSSPLILLNDLILTSNQALPVSQQMDSWSLFSVTPIGLALVATGIIYFVLAGRYVLPKVLVDNSKITDPMDYFREVYNIEYAVYELVVTDKSKLIGQKLDDIETKYRVRIIANKIGSEQSQIGPGTLARDTEFQSEMVLGVVAAPGHLDYFVEKYDLIKRDVMSSFVEDLSTAKAGIAEIVIPPSSKLVGKSARDIWLRKVYGLALVALHRNGETMREGDDIRSKPFQSGDTLVVHTTWQALDRVSRDKNFIVVTTEYPHEEKLRPEKLQWASLFFILSLSLVLFSELKLSIALLTGAIGMILSGVLKMEEAYEAVSWKTVFLLASLIPLGMAAESSGTAKWIADQVLSVVGDQPIWVIQLAIVILSTFFTLVMSNVGATVLLVPLAVNIAIGVDANPAVFALTVALATSNSFLIPTHQVNALIMGPGGYSVADFMKAGGIMTILFIVVLMLMMTALF